MATRKAMGEDWAEVVRLYRDARERLASLVFQSLDKIEPSWRGLPLDERLVLAEPILDDVFVCLRTLTPDELGKNEPYQWVCWLEDRIGGESVEDRG